MLSNKVTNYNALNTHNASEIFQAYSVLRASTMPSTYMNYSPSIFKLVSWRQNGAFKAEMDMPIPQYDANIFQPKNETNVNVTQGYKDGIADSADAGRFMFSVKRLTPSSFVHRATGNNEIIANKTSRIVRSFCGSIYQSNTGINEYTCSPSQLSSVSDRVEFAEIQNEEIKKIIEREVIKSIFAPVVESTTESGGNPIQKVLTIKDDTKDREIDLTGAGALTTPNINAQFLKVPSGKIGKQSFIWVLPESILSWLMSKQKEINALNPSTAALFFETDKESLMVLSSGYRLLGIDDKYFPKDGNKFITFLLPMGSLAGSFVSPYTSEAFGGKGANSNNAFAQIAAFNKTHWGITEATNLVWIESDKELALNFNSMVTLMFGFVVGRIDARNIWRVMVDVNPVVK